MDVIFFESRLFFFRFLSFSFFFCSSFLISTDIGPSSPAKPLFVYHRRQPTPSIATDPTPASASGPDHSTADPDVPDALWKGKHACTGHLIERFVSYYAVSPSYCSFLTTLGNNKIPKRIDTALHDPS